MKLPEAPSDLSVAMNGIGDADATDDKRGQADEGEELREALDIARQ